MGWVFTLTAVDFVMEFMGVRYFMLDWRVISVAFLWGMILGATKSNLVFFGTVIIMGVLELMQSSFISYFGREMGVDDIILMYRNFSDVCSECIDKLLDYWLLPSIILLVYSVPFLLRKYIKTRKSHIASILSLTLFSITPIDAYNRAMMSRFVPRPKVMSVLNNINAFSGVFYFLNPKHQLSEKYIPYEVTRTSSPVKNVVYIITETFALEHTSLFGYNRNTTPNMLEFSKQENFLFKEAYSSAVSTMLSMALTLNTVREPQNFGGVSSRRSNLFALAKVQNMNTYFIGSQSRSVVSNSSGTYLDHIIGCGDPKDRDLVKKYKDYILMKYIKEGKLSRTNNFIVLNTKNLHAPYSDNYFPDFTFYKVEGTKKERTINDYDNSMHQYDDWLKKMIESLQENLDGETYVFVTGDHGELFGEDSLYSHGHLVPKCAKVPFLLFILNMEESGKHYIEELDKKDIYSHYDMGKLIAKLLGFEIVNPNDNDNSRFIGSLDFYAPKSIKYYILKDTIKSQIYTSKS